MSRLATRPAITATVVIRWRHNRATTTNRCLVTMRRPATDRCRRPTCAAGTATRATIMVIASAGTTGVTVTGTTTATMARAIRMEVDIKAAGVTGVDEDTDQVTSTLALTRR